MTHLFYTNSRKSMFNSILFFYIFLFIYKNYIFLAYFYHLNPLLSFKEKIIYLLTSFIKRKGDSMKIDYQLKSQELEKERRFIEEYCFYDREVLKNDKQSDTPIVEQSRLCHS